MPGSDSIHILLTIVLDYGELLAYWFILQLDVEGSGRWGPPDNGHVMQRFDWVSGNVIDAQAVVVAIVVVAPLGQVHDPG